MPHSVGARRPAAVAIIMLVDEGLACAITCIELSQWLRKITGCSAALRSVHEALKDPDMFLCSYICTHAVNTVCASEYLGLICTEKPQLEACSLQHGGTSAPDAFFLRDCFSRIQWVNNCLLRLLSAALVCCVFQASR